MLSTAAAAMKPSTSPQALPKDCPTCAGVRTPSKGNTASGISEVNGMGTGSKTHQVAHSKVTDAVTAEADDQSFRLSSKNNSIAARGPM